MRRIPISRPSSWFADAVIFLFVGGLIYGIVAFGAQWESQFNPNYEIDLDLSSLPMYALFSALRGLIAYGVSLVFTFVIGYWAAKSPRAEGIILPCLDVMQSIPVLGFLPGLVLGLVSLFPHTNVGLELAAILMIFSSQVWNMTFAFHSSLKSVPADLKEAAGVMKLSSMQRLELLELPISAMNLTWNSVLSMAGGWFFLTVCEAFTLGDQHYRLPGLGAYMAVAIEKGDNEAMVGGIVAMVAIILLFDMLLWRPALMWAHKFRLEESDSQKIEEPLIQLLIRDSYVARFFKWLSYRPYQAQIQKIKRLRFPRLKFLEEGPKTVRGQQALSFMLGLVSAIALGYGTLRLLSLLAGVSASEWGAILLNTVFTLLRVFAATIIATLWATPVGIWVTLSPRRLRIAQPLIQLLASFPSPMLYPLAVGFFLFLNISFEISAMLLMLLGIQWYILFNVLAGALRIPHELRLSLLLMGSSKWNIWRFLYIPSILPSLVTGWMMAAGGAWNASIVAEVFDYNGTKFEAHGLGTQISKAAASGDFPRLAACLFVMVVVVVGLNRTLWARLYNRAQLRYRMEL